MTPTTFLLVLLAMALIGAVFYFLGRRMGELSGPLFTRVGLFFLINLAVIVVASLVLLVLSLLGLDDYIPDVAGAGLNHTALFIVCAVFGFTGAFLSLLLSRWMAKRITRTRVIDDPSDPTEEWLLDTTRELARRAGIVTPQVGIFPASEPNAFATGPGRNKSLVAVSKGLLDKLPRDETRAVLGHEIGHVANGDMVTLTLLQGVVNTFVLFFAHIVGRIVGRLVWQNEGGWAAFAVRIVAQIVFGTLALPIVMWFSRRREFRADAAGARLAGREAMISALESLRGGYGRGQAMPESVAAFGISASARSGIQRLFSSHPPLNARIHALQSAVPRAPAGANLV